MISYCDDDDGVVCHKQGQCTSTSMMLVVNII